MKKKWLHWVIWSEGTNIPMKLSIAFLTAMSLSRRQCDSVLHTCYFSFSSPIHVLGMRLYTLQGLWDTNYICMSYYKYHLSILQQNTSSSINWADISTRKQQLQNCEDTLTSLCSQQCCMHVAMEILKKGPSFSVGEWDIRMIQWNEAYSSHKDCIYNLICMLDMKFMEQN